MQTYAVNIDCVACPRVEHIYVEPQDYVRWLTKGVHAQDAFSYLTIDERESIITSMCLDCIDEVYAGMEEEKEEELYDLEYEYAVFMDEQDVQSAIDPESDLFEYASDWYVD
jgi:hypothetical protein